MRVARCFILTRLCLYMVKNEASVPRQKDLFKPIMQVLSDGSDKTVNEIVEGVVSIMGLGPEVIRIESRQKGKSLLKYNTEWSLTNLSNAGFVKITGRGVRCITPEGKKALESDYDWESLPQLKPKDEDSALQDPQITEIRPDETGTSGSFFDYIRSRGLTYDTRLIEDFLLSLKAKQFLVLSGGSGTGKTKLAQEYGRFISSRTHPDATEVSFSVTLGKSGENGGYTLSSDKFFEAFPQYKKLNGQYRFNIGGTDGLCRIQMTPRLWFRGNEGDEEIFKTIEQLKEHQSKADLKLIIDKDGSHSSGSNYVIIPVGSNWTDSRSIIGYKNVLTDKYCHTPALDLMIEADSDESDPRILILDEMNLSHVEWYFSDLLSSMESGEPIRIESDGDVPDSVRTGDNLFVIGTVNMDETTYAFSPKVLDRANVIEFQPISVATLLKDDKESEEPKGNVQFLQDCMAGIEVRSKGAAELIGEITAVTENANIVEAMIGDVDALQRLMSSIGLPFGFRTVDEIMRFMSVAWEYEGCGEFTNWKRYLDSQIMQKILPKIHGNTSIRKCLDDMKQFCTENGYSQSSDKLDRMLKILESQRYVSFNS